MLLYESAHAAALPMEPLYSDSRRLERMVVVSGVRNVSARNPIWLCTSLFHALAAGSKAVNNVAPILKSMVLDGQRFRNQPRQGEVSHLVPEQHHGLHELGHAGTDTSMHHGFSSSSETWTKMDIFAAMVRRSHGTFI